MHTHDMRFDSYAVLVIVSFLLSNGLAIDLFENPAIDHWICESPRETFCFSGLNCINGTLFFFFFLSLSMFTDAAIPAWVPERVLWMHSSINGRVSGALEIVAEFETLPLAGLDATIAFESEWPSLFEATLYIGSEALDIRFLNESIPLRLADGSLPSASGTMPLRLELSVQQQFSNESYYLVISSFQIEQETSSALEDRAIAGLVTGVLLCGAWIIVCVAPISRRLNHIKPIRSFYVFVRL